jgi:hypothetical protein
VTWKPPNVAANETGRRAMVHQAGQCAGAAAKRITFDSEGKLNDLML